MFSRPVLLLIRTLIQATAVALLLIGMFVLTDWLGWRMDHRHAYSLSLANSFSTKVWTDSWWYALLLVYVLLGNAACWIIRGFSLRAKLAITLLGLCLGFVLLLLAYTESSGHWYGVRDTFRPNKLLCLCAYILIPTSFCAGIRIVASRLRPPVPAERKLSRS